MSAGAREWIDLMRMGLRELWVRAKTREQSNRALDASLELMRLVAQAGASR